jgi:inosine/xanthosine triphosphatase
MIHGAKIRAKHCLTNLEKEADFGVGIEGGIASNKYGTFLKAWVVILTKTNEIGIGSSPAILMPKTWTEAITETHELGKVVDSNAGTGKTNIKQKEGAFGVLTDNLIERKDALSLAVISALSVIKKKKLYK